MRRRVLGSIVFLVVVTIVGALLLDHRAMLRDLRADERRIQAAPVPDGSELISSELRTTGFCLQIGCPTPQVEVRWRVAEDGDPCLVPADIARRWGLARTRSGGPCRVTGFLEGTRVYLLMDADDPHLLIARS